MTSLRVNNKIFVDSNVLVALYRRDDSLHDKAVKVTQDLDKLGPIYITNNYCINEALTILLLRTKSLEASLHLGWMVYEKGNPWFKMLQVDQKIQHKSWNFFKQQKPKDQASFTDCTILTQVKSRKIKRIFSFDENLKKSASNELEIIS